jgi:hypothetical protein
MLSDEEVGIPQYAKWRQIGADKEGEEMWYAGNGVLVE